LYKANQANWGLAATGAAGSEKPFYLIIKDLPGIFDRLALSLASGRAI